MVLSSYRSTAQNIGLYCKKKTAHWSGYIRLLPGTDLHADDSVDEE